MGDSLQRALQMARENLRSGRSISEGIPPQQWQQLLNRYSHFVDHRDPDGYLIDSEVVITDLHTPRPCLHLMASTQNDGDAVWGSFWDQFGGGFSCLISVLAGRMTSHLDTNYVPTAPEPQDVRRFFIHENGRAWPMFMVPYFDESEYRDARCVQGPDRHCMQAERSGLLSELTVCVHPRLPLELWIVRITNRDSAPRRFSWFCSARVNIDSFPSHYFVPRVVCEGLIEDGAMVFLNHDQNNRHPRQAFFAALPVFDAFDMMGEAFDGAGGRSPIPVAVLDDRCRDSLGLQPYAGLVAAAQFRVELAVGESRQWACVYGACPVNRDSRAAFLAKVRAEVLSQPEQVTASVRRIWADRVTACMCKTPSEAVDRYFNVWSKVQGRNQSRFCRALDKVGFRDILQDLMSVCECEPAFVRERMLHTLRFQSEDGRSVRQYEACPGAGNDLRMYMDSSSWVPDALVWYIEETGDFGVLDEHVPYFNMVTERPDQSATGTVYEHAVRAVRSLVQATGYHGLCRIGYGDWNDALSGIGGEQGVSVWLSCACVFAAQRMELLARHLGRTEDAAEMRGVVETMTERVNEHAWDGQWYIYAINGDGKPIGSKDSPEGRIHLNSNTWALFTGIARAAGREKAAWDAVERLSTPVGHMLLGPPYTAATRRDVGRIADQKPGMFENGSIYIHGEAWYLYALIAARRADECCRRMLETLPSEMVQDIATGPRHQQSNFTVGSDHPNYGMQPFSGFTGSVIWYRRVIECMLGLRPGLGGLIVDPCPPKEWDRFEVRRTWRGRSIRAGFRRGQLPGCRIRLNGKPCTSPVPEALLDRDRVNEIEVDFG